MQRYADLVDTVTRHQILASENYERTRALAETVRAGFCQFLDAPGGDCVFLVPPGGPFEPRNHGDQAFSMPAEGFRPILPIAFGLAVRVTLQGQWTRIVLLCWKDGEHFRIDLAEGKSHVFPLPFEAGDHGAFFAALHDHLLEGFRDQIRQYEDGDYGSRDIGFELGAEQADADGRSRVDPVAATRSTSNGPARGA